MGDIKMRARHLGALAASTFIAGLTVLRASTAAASTVNLTYNYVFFAGGQHTGQPRFQTVRLTL
jgi:hypothetical protein